MSKANSVTVVVTPATREKIRALYERMPKDGTWQVTFEEVTNDRTLAQNRLAFMWYKELAKQRGTDPGYERNFCKLRYGCPIMAADDEEFAAAFNDVILKLPYRKQINAMEYLEVTRLMDTTQFTQYLNDIEREASEHGYILTHPDDVYERAMGVKRRK